MAAGTRLNEIQYSMLEEGAGGPHDIHLLDNVLERPTMASGNN